MRASLFVFSFAVLATSELAADVAALEDALLQDACSKDECNEGISLIQNSAVYIKRGKAQAIGAAMWQTSQQPDAFEPHTLVEKGEQFSLRSKNGADGAIEKETKESFERALDVLKDDDTLDSSLKRNEPFAEHSYTNLCQRNPVQRGDRHKLCSTAECGPPPLAFMVVANEADGRTVLESFDSPDEAGFNTNWKNYLTRTELNGQMTVEKQKCSCNGCDEWNEWAIKELAKPYECKYPSHTWELLFADPNPLYTGPRHEDVTEGRHFLTTNRYMDEIGLTSSEAFKGFSTAKYSHMAAKEKKSTWQSKRSLSEAWHVTQGQPVSVWQYHLKCKVFNAVGMYINEAQFGTSIKVRTNGTAQPVCDPTVDNCGQDGGTVTNC